MLKKMTCALVSALLLCTTALPILAYAAEEPKKALPQLTYQTHVSGIGWQSAVSAGQVAGAPDQGKVIEALRIELNGADDLGIAYSAHVQNVGWQNPVENGEVTGTTGRALRMEAIQMELTGSEAEQYDLYYRVEVADFGLLDWAKNGEAAGSQGMSCHCCQLRFYCYQKTAGMRLRQATAAF